MWSTNLLLALAFPALSTTEFGSACLITAVDTTLGRLPLLRFLEMVLGNPFLRVSASTSSSDGSNGGADGSCGLALLRLRNESEVGVVTNSAENTENDEVGNPAVVIRDSVQKSVDSMRIE